jgi:hypothetical protein
MTLQVNDTEKAMKMQIHPRKTLLSFDFLAALRREELHQFRNGLYHDGEHFIPSAFHSLTSVLRKPEFILSNNEMLENVLVWVLLHDRLTSLDSSTALLEATSEYAAHFYDM